jgi:hypothetical protein
MLADSLEGVRSIGAVKWCRFAAGNSCEGPNSEHTEVRSKDPRTPKLQTVNDELRT